MMMSKVRSFVVAAAALLALPCVATAIEAPCGRPASGGDVPVARDALAALKASVGTYQCNPACVCDVDASGTTVATDASIILRVATGIPLALACDCAVCGDDFQDPGEQCDNGDTADGDGCDADCVLEECGNGKPQSGEECDTGGDTDTCDADCSAAECGDGTLNQANDEDCDTGGETQDCDDDCTIADCGDGTVNETAGETCDDYRDSAECDRDCSEPACPDGLVNYAADEGCDDGNTAAGDGCSEDCRLEKCGDGNVDAVPFEQCDDGNTVGGDGCSEHCRIDGDALACTSAQVEWRAGSQLDFGSTGFGHDAPLPAGATTAVSVVRRCVSDGSACRTHSDCPESVCAPTCDCVADSSCELTGPTGPRHCLTTLADCTTNADCPTNVECVATLAPPIPLSLAGSPICAVTHFAAPLQGSADFTTGDYDLSTTLRTRIFLGIAVSQPCPRCGDVEETPTVGDTFTCDGGQRPGDPCTVDGVVADFGGVSYDCAPGLAGNISGPGVTWPLPELTSGSIERTAELPCADPPFYSNPTLGTGRCVDDLNGPACSTNADCRRCTGDIEVACTSNAQCEGKGTCAASPHQPITCGFWCHCGFCDGNASQPCFGDQDCQAGQSCVAGPGTGNVSNRPQRAPNGCEADGFVCGTVEAGRCAQTLVGHCQEEPSQVCDGPSDSCGECLFDSLPCFGSTVRREGEVSPLANYCTDSGLTCQSNADCGGEQQCLTEATMPALTALTCSPATASAFVNAAAGLTGPVALRAELLLRICRCGDGALGCDEQCDDGNAVDGDGCSALCQDE